MTVEVCADCGLLNSWNTVDGCHVCPPQPETYFARLRWAYGRLCASYNMAVEARDSKRARIIGHSLNRVAARIALQRIDLTPGQRHSCELQSRQWL